MLFSEIEVIEACKWLKAAGFPQYAQMYEGTYEGMWKYYYTIIDVELVFSYFSFCIDLNVENDLDYLCVLCIWFFISI